jgi:hypothetical protein
MNHSSRTRNHIRCRNQYTKINMSSHRNPVGGTSPVESGKNLARGTSSIVGAHQVIGTNRDVGTSPGKGINQPVGIRSMEGNKTKNIFRIWEKIRQNESMKSKITQLYTLSIKETCPQKQKPKPNPCNHSAENLYTEVKKIHPSHDTIIRFMSGKG